MRKRNRHLIIGLTGGFATGKTSAAKILKGRGAAILDADKTAHRALRKNTATYRSVVRAFGEEIVGPDGRIDRAALSRLAFLSKANLRKLCEIIHPAVIKEIKESVDRIKKTRGAPAVVIDAPLLIETGLHKTADRLIVVTCKRETQIKRAMKKTRLSRREVIKRIKAQMPLSKKVKIADYVIDNEGARAKMGKAIKKIWEGMKSGDDR